MTAREKRAHKFAVSIPATLFERGEVERERLGISRSEYVASLYREHQRTRRREEKIARYRVAYAEHPITPEEDALTTESMAVLASEPT
jgi:metal-responsive CopG/Arc/MetJ family transcriptional regulator